MRLIALPMILAGCGGTLVVEVTQDECASAGGEPELVVERAGADVLVYRTGAEVGEYDVFDPEVEVSGKTITVHEYWDEDPGSAQLVCAEPGIRLVEPLDRRYTVEWLDGDSPWLEQSFEP